MFSPQGNGHERDFMGDQRVYIMDVYNRHIYPGDRFAKRKLPATFSPEFTLAWMGFSPEYFLCAGCCKVGIISIVQMRKLRPKEVT